MNKVKVIMLGDSGVGKTSMLLQLTEQRFSTAVTSTLGIDFCVCEFDRNVKLQIFDTSGQERFQGIVQAYFRDADVVVIVYDKCNRASFDHVLQWRQRAMQAAIKQQLYVLVGNKQDLPATRVSTEEGRAFAKLHSFNLFFEATATSSTRALFETIAQTVPCKYDVPCKQSEPVHAANCCCVM